MKVIVVGGGPVACLVASKFRARGMEVRVYERDNDPRIPSRRWRHSFNMTLTLRGLSALGPKMRDSLYASGVPLSHRVIHHADRTSTYQPYGTSADHHLLSVGRDLLHQTLLSEAEGAGAEFFFGHECIRVDTRNGKTTFVADGGLYTDEADLIVGCDGANSITRSEMSRNGGRLRIQQEFIEHGYIELRMSLLRGHDEVLYSSPPPLNFEAGMHLWPRGNFLLIAQPNKDDSYTTTLFLPLMSRSNGNPSFCQLTTPEKMHQFFLEQFPEVEPFLVDSRDSLVISNPASLKTVRCGPFHHGRTVLLGDSAHTMVPFYGQGINCSFEDVAKFFDLLDQVDVAQTPVEQKVLTTLSAFTELRQKTCDTIADLSLGNLAELATRLREPAFYKRGQLERELHRRVPELFMPLYQRIAFTNIPYDQAFARSQAEKKVLDSLCERFDYETEQEKIFAAYIEHMTCQEEKQRQILRTETGDLPKFSVRKG